jgi:hypothetical protein
MSPDAVDDDGLVGMWESRALREISKAGWTLVLGASTPCVDARRPGSQVPERGPRMGMVLGVLQPHALNRPARRRGAVITSATQLSRRP